MKNISKIIPTLFLILSTLILFFILYKLEFSFAETNFDYYKNYFFISCILIFLSIISFFIKEELKIKIAIILGCVITTAYIFEGFILYSEKIKSKRNEREFIKKAILEYKKRTGEEYDLRNRYTIYKELKKQDPNIVVGLRPVNFLNDNQPFFPLSGISNSKTIHCNENGYYSIFESDRYGFNNPDKEWENEEIEFLIVGDSFAWGNCVNEPYTIGGNLRSMLNKSGVLNLGQAGNGPLTEYATLKEYISIKKVKKVLWLYYEEDLIDLKKELNNPTLKKYFENKNFSQNLKFRQNEIDQKLYIKLEEKILEKKELSEEKFKNLKKFIKLYSIREKVKKNLFSSKLPLQEFEKIIKLSNELSKRNNSKFYFVYIPAYSRYLKNNNNDSYKNYQNVIKIVKNLGIPIIDINNELLKKVNDPFDLFAFRLNKHFNKLGYKLVSETIFQNVN